MDNAISRARATAARLDLVIGVHAGDALRRAIADAVNATTASVRVTVPGPETGTGNRTGRF